MGETVKRLLLLLPLLCGMGWGVPVVVQGKECNSHTCQFNSNTTHGNAIYILNGATACVSNNDPSDSEGNPFSANLITCNSTTGNAFTGAYCASNIAGGTLDTITMNNATGQDVAIIEASGTTCTVDAHNEGAVAGPTTTPASASINTTNASDLVLAYFTNFNGGAPGISGYNNSFSVATTDAGWTAGSAYRAVAATGSYSTTATYGGSAISNWETGTIAFQASGGTSTPKTCIIGGGLVC